MKINAHVTLAGEGVILVPYRKEHVPLYHAWMQDPLLQEATASEPLTLQEEFDMQKSWAEDSDKCTFILLDPVLPDTEGTGQHGGGMIGDVNLFLNDADEPTVAEIEIMIAVKASRRKGLAFEALTIFMAYAVKYLGITCFQAKIGLSNQSSLNLFGKLGYAEISRSKIFNEATMTLQICGHIKAWLNEQAHKLKMGHYDDGTEAS